MKFFVSVFLLILCFVSVVKIVLSIKCHQTEESSELNCRRKYLKEIRRSKRLGYNELSHFFACIRNGAKKESDPNCVEWVNATCYTLTYELNDRTQHMIKGCDNSEHTYCPHMKENLDAEFTDLGPPFFKTSHCEFCSSDNCNDQKPKDEPTPPSNSPPPPGMGADIKCHYSGYDCLEYVNISLAIDCLRNASKEDKSGPCPLGSTACLKMSIKLKDGEQLVSRGCWNPEISSSCEEAKEKNGKTFQAKVECEICETNFCNGETPSAEKQTPSAEKHSQEIHSGRSHSLATSIKPIAFGILIFNLLVQFLL